MINAAGYVRVDDAERDCEACFSVNTDRRGQRRDRLPAAGLPLVSYSSDLVFGGDREHPYTERDSPRPLNVYGASKAEAERRVLDVMPEALVVRTSAFFGPWDTSNFVVRALPTIRHGRRWRAAADIVVSPTYVPDLVNAALDLLLDGESGIWHLSNDGAVSWFEFARSAAEACGDGRPDRTGDRRRARLAGGATKLQCARQRPRPRHAIDGGRAECIRTTHAASDASRVMRYVHA